LSTYLATPIRFVFADAGFAGKLVDWTKRILKTTLHIVRKPQGPQRFTVLPRRWDVERKSRAGVRTVPLPPFLVDAFRQHRRSGDLVFPSRTGGPLRRNNFRRRVWLPSLVRAGLLGEVTELNGRYEARWQVRTGKEASAVFSTREEAESQIASAAFGGPRFHDLRRSYASWLVSEGVPVNVVRRVMGHEQTSTTLDIYTHAPDDYENRVLAAFSASRGDGAYRGG
jgi:integrase